MINGKILNSLISNSELVTFEGGGHLFLLTHSDESVEAIRDFLDAPETDEEQERASAYAA
jgi:pimeloyl-ACP methyl ester carboxylesterase